jgi:predicted nucleic acid-binding protein
MHSVFVDTSAWFALATDKDVNHSSAREFLAKANTLVTTNFIIDETITLTRVRVDHKSALWMGSRLWSGELATIIWVTPDDEQAAWKLFNQYDDKIFSFTDCTSFAVMNRLGLTHAFTFDSDFDQTGQFRRIP